MAVYRVDVLTEDPEPVFDWLRATVPDDQIVRRVGFVTVKGVHLKVVFRRQSDAETFARRWLPERDDFTVGPFGEGPTPTSTVPPGRSAAWQKRSVGEAGSESRTQTTWSRLLGWLGCSV